MAYNKGQRILANWIEDNLHYPAIITETRNHNREFYIKFLKGDRHWLESSKLHPYDIEIGETVRFRMHGTTAFNFRGIIETIEEESLTVLLEGSEQRLTIGIEDFCVHR